MLIIIRTVQCFLSNEEGKLALYCIIKLVIGMIYIRKTVNVNGSRFRFNAVADKRHFSIAF